MYTLELKIPPVIVLLLVAAGMWLVARAVPSLTFPLPYSRIIAITFMVIGFSVSVIGVLSFQRAGTTIDPMKPQKASSLVSSGIYRFSRNPMYLGMLLVLIGWSVYLSNIASLLLVPLFVLWMNRFQIAPEERALASLFGPDFESYKQEVRRWV